MRTDDHYDNNLTRPEIIELCQRLGHDPTHVSRITIEPNSITVIDECHHLIDGTTTVERMEQDQ